MQFEFNNEEALLLLQTLAKYHMMQFMAGTDNSGLEKLIQNIAKTLQDNDLKEEIFDRVFFEVAKNESE